MKKFLLGAVISCFAVTASQAAVTYDEATSKLTGNVDLDLFYSGLPIVLTVIGTTIAVNLVFGMLKRAK